MSLTPIKRSSVIHLLNTGTTSSPTWNLINEGVTELTENFNPDTDSLQYVAEDSATTVVKRYAPSISLTAVIVNGDPVNEWIRTQINTLPLGENADTQYIRFCVLDKISTGSTTPNEYTAYMRNAVISVDSIGGEAGDNVNTTVNLNGKGDQIKGKVTVTTTTDTDGKKITTYTFTSD